MSELESIKAQYHIAKLKLYSYKTKKTNYKESKVADYVIEVYDLIHYLIMENEKDKALEILELCQEELKTLSATKNLSRPYSRNPFLRDNDTFGPMLPGVSE